MSVSPMSAPSAPANVEPSGEILAASMAKKQQQMEGQAAIQLLQTAGQVAPPPSGSSGHNVNIMV